MRLVPTFKIILPVLLFGLFLLQPVFSQNYPSSWESRGVGGGGAVYAPTISPHNPNEMYLTCDMSIAHHSTDFGQHWSIIPSSTLRTGRNASVQFTASPDTLYAMHRAAQTSVHTPYRSTNGGLTWAPTASNPFGPNGVFQIYTHPGKTNTSIAASYSAIWLDTAAGANYQQVYSTTDTKGTHLAGVFCAGDSLYICHNKGLKYSFDNGQSWTALGLTGMGSGEEIVSFRAAREGGTLRCIAVTLTAPDVHPRVYGNTGVTHFKNVYRMDLPAQNTWTSITGGLPNPANDRLYNIAVVGNEIDTFYVAGQAWVSGIRLGSVFRTDNGGASFQNIFLDAGALASNDDIAPGWKATATSNSYMHRWNGISSTEGLCVDPNNLRRIARSDLTAVHTSEDYGQNWTQAYTLPQQPHPAGSPISTTDTYVTSGLETTVGYWIHFVSENNIFAGFGDIMLTHSTDGGTAWQMLYNGLFFPMLNDVNHITEPPNGNLYAATGEVPGTNGQYNDSRLAITPGKLAYSTDQGQSWQTKTDFGHPVLWTALNPTNANQLFAAVPDIPSGNGAIWRCDDIANCNVLTDWVQLPAPPRTEGRAQEIFVLSDGTLVATYGPRDIGNFSFTASSGVFRRGPNDPNWFDATPSPMQYDLRSLSIDPHNEDIWFACIGKNGPGTRGLYRTLDRGENWTLVQTGMTVVSVTFHPDLPNSLYFCTSNDGLFFATETNADFNATAISSYPFDFPQRVFFNPFDHDEVWVQNFGNGLRVGRTLVLPLELLHFEARCKEETVLLEWATAAEFNTAYFAVEKSTDGLSFFELGRLPAHGQAGQYEFADPSLPDNLVYYRLRMVDLDEKFTYSPMIVPGACPSPAYRLRVFPNPASPEWNIEVTAPAQQPGTLRLFDVLGRERWQQAAPENGLTILSAQDLHLPRGVYFLQWSVQGRVVDTLRLVY